MRRKDREMNETFALGVADACEYAVLGMTDADGAPYCVPVNVVREGGDFYFHCAKSGAKTDNMRRDPRVMLVFCTNVAVVEHLFTTQYDSAIVRGEASEVTDDVQKIRVLRLLCEKLTPNNMHEFDAAIERSLSRTAIWRISAQEITGKRKKYAQDGRELKYGEIE